MAKLHGSLECREKWYRLVERRVKGKAEWQVEDITFGYYGDYYDDPVES